MNPNWIGVGAATGAVIVFFVTFRLLSGRSHQVRATFAIAATLLAVPGASFALYYSHLFPETDWYYEFRSWRGTEFLVLFLGLAGGAWATLLSRFLRIAPLLGTLVLAFVPFIKPFVGPLALDSMSNRWQENVCLQSTQSTCGLASVATVLRNYEIDSTEKEIARVCHTYAGGTESWYLARYVRSTGCSARFHMTSGIQRDIPLPAVAGVRIGNIGHFIPILSNSGDEWIIGDPLRGRESLSHAQLMDRYEFTGFYLCVGRP